MMAGPSRTPSYAGIGSRRTPPETLGQMRAIAARLARRGLVLRSGGADGADTAFEAGCDAAGGQKEIYLPARAFNGNGSRLFPPSQAALDLAAQIHPTWSHLSVFAQQLHGRNSHQVLGVSLDDPVLFVLAWTPDGAENEFERSRETGGTGQAIALASRQQVPVINLARPGALDRIAAILRAHGVIAAEDHRADGHAPATGKAGSSDEATAGLLVIQSAPASAANRVYVAEAGQADIFGDPGQPGSAATPFVPGRIRFRRGVRLPANATYVGRPSVWGNPFVVGSASYPTRVEAVAAMRVWVKGQPALIERAKRELRGRTLACWCPVGDGLPCHADIWLELANAD